jgi:hypothetical protein
MAQPTTASGDRRVHLLEAHEARTHLLDVITVVVP